MSSERNDRTSSAQVRRKRLFVDARLQGALLAHTTLYWFYCLLSISVIAIAWIVLVNQPPTSADLFQQLWQNVGPGLVGAVILLPLVLLDCLRLSNRFAGPMVRFQRAMKQFADGETPQKIKLRDGDYWCEFAENFNRVIDRVNAPVEVKKNADVSPFAETPLPGVQTPPATNIAPVNLTSANIYADVTV